MLVGKGRWTVLGLAAIVAQPSAEAAETRNFSVNAGRLDQAIMQIGRQAGVSIVLGDPDMGRINVGRVTGVMDVETALRRLLRGTGLGPQFIDSRNIRIVRVAPPPRRAPPPQPARPRPEPRLVAAAPDAVRPADTIVVTASKRDVLLDDYPAAVSVLTLDRGDDRVPGVYGTSAIIRQLPSLNSTNLGPGQNKLFIRGVADSSFTGPTQATVGQYFGYARLNYNAPDPDLELYDIAKVEVLEGPQGTLYGAGSLGGIVRVDPNMPDMAQAAGSLRAGYMLTQHGAPSHDAAAMLNLPLISDQAALRLVGYHISDGGYIDDSERGLRNVNRSRIVGGRAAIRVAPGDGWTVDAGWIRQDIQTRDGQYSERGLPELTRRSAIAQPFDNDYSLVYATVGKSWDGLVLRSTASAVSHRLYNRFDATALGEGAPLAFTQNIAIHQLASETTLARPGAHGHGWIVGFSLSDGRDRTARALGDPAAPAPISDLLNERTEWSAFGEWTFGLTSRLSGSVGARFSRTRFAGERLDMPTADGELRRVVSDLVPALALRWKPGGDWLVYARYQEGFRPGGLSISAPTMVVRFVSDTIGTYEVGARFGVAGRDRFNAAIAASYARWESIQADLVDARGFPYTDNIGNGEILGISGSVGWQATPSLRVDGAAFLNDSGLTQPAPAYAGAADNDLPNIARWGVRLGFRWTRPLGAGRVALAGGARYVGPSFLGVGNLLDIGQGRYIDTGLEIRFERGPVALGLGISNLFNADQNRFSYGNPFTVLQGRQETPLRPRSVRIGLDAKF